MNEESVRAAMAQLDEAFVAGDYAALDALTADRFLLVNPLAQVLAKHDWLAWLAATIRYERVVREDVTIRLAENCAIVCGPVRAWMAVTGLFDGATTVHHTYRTEVWTWAEDFPLLQHVHLTRMEPPA